MSASANPVKKDWSATVKEMLKIIEPACLSENLMMCAGLWIALFKFQI